MNTPPKFENKWKRKMYELLDQSINYYGESTYWIEIKEIIDVLILHWNGDIKLKQKAFQMIHFQLENSYFLWIDLIYKKRPLVWRLTGLIF